MEDILVSVVIPVGADGELLDQCLDAVARQDFPKKEVIVVCDQRTAANVHLPEGSEDLRIIREHQPSPSNGLLNAGMRAARGHIKILLMPYCIPVGTGWMRAMAAPFEDDAVGVVVSQRLPAAAGRGGIAARLLDAADPPARQSAEAGPTSQEMVSHLSDAYRASLLADIGYFATDGLAGQAQAIDVSVKLGDAGYSILLSDSAAVTYHVPKSRQRLGAAMRQAWDYGRADALLDKMHGVHWLNAGVLAASLFSLFLLPVAAVSLPFAVILSALLFAWSAFLSVRLPIVRWECPLAIANFAVYIAIILPIRADWWPAVLGKEVHPAIIRQWCWLVAVTSWDVLVLAKTSLSGALRAVRRATDLPYILPTFLFGLLWWLLAGLGHVAGPLFAGRRERRSKRAR